MTGNPQSGGVAMAVPPALPPMAVSSDLAGGATTWASQQCRLPIFLAPPANPWDDGLGQVANEKNPARDGRQAGRRSQGNA